MSNDERADRGRVDALHERLRREARASGYNLNPDEEFTRSLIEGLLVNEDRVGYRSCPCRMASGERMADLDIVCPCDYRDPDLAEWGMCYCALYVSQDVLDGKREIGPIPERRPIPEDRPVARGAAADDSSEGMTVWRCPVCGYLCAREAPPEKCPICKASGERFVRFARP